MIIELDDHVLHSPGSASVRARAAAPYRHAAVRVTIKPNPVPVFEVVAEPVTSRLALVGEFDLACGQQFREASGAIRAAGAVEVIIDLGRLQFIDTSGVGCLVGLRDELAMRAATLRVVDAGARVARVFSLCGVDAMLTGPPALASRRPSAARAVRR